MFSVSILYDDYDQLSLITLIPTVDLFYIYLSHFHLYLESTTFVFSKFLSCFQIPVFYFSNSRRVFFQIPVGFFFKFPSCLTVLYLALASLFVN